MPKKRAFAGIFRKKPKKNQKIRKKFILGVDKLLKWVYT